MFQFMVMVWFWLKQKEQGLFGEGNCKNFETVYLWCK